jgi:Flp pilus assembly pilin Flp
MATLLTALAHLMRDDKAQDLLEYSLLVVLIAVVVASSVTTLGTTIRTVFWDVIAAQS